MLYVIPEMKSIKYIPYAKEYRVWRSRLTNEEYVAIADELNSRINGGEIHTSSWIPGSNWRGTVYHPIYEKACLNDENEAAKCFGLFLWVVMMEREEAWSFGRYEKNNIPIEGLTYFRITI